MALDIKTVPSTEMTPAQVEDVVALCGGVFDCDYRHLLEINPVRTHILGYANGQLAAHALWLDRPLRIAWGSWLDAAYVEGVATHPDLRGRGYARAVMRRLQEEVQRYPLAALSPASDAIDWYVSLGWERWQGPLFIEEECAVQPTPDETVLIYRTPQTGALDLAAALAAPWRPFELW